MSNPWDKLSEKFKGAVNTDEIDPDAADNILIAWPPILERLDKHFNGNKDISIIDYGCGTGTFCNKLFSLGYHQILGVDASEEMIKLARQQFGEQIDFMHADATVNPLFFNVDAVTSIMALQFVKDIQKALTSLVALIKPGGVLIFAVHNPATVVASFKILNDLFSGFSSLTNPKDGQINLGGIGVPIYIRTADEYNSILKNLGMEMILEDYPKFTKEFLEKFGSSTPDVPHFMILGFKKK